MNTPGVYDDVSELRGIDDGTRIHVRYWTVASNFENEQEVTGTVTVIHNRIEVQTATGPYHVVTGRGDAQRPKGEVLSRAASPTDRRVGVFKRAEVARNE